MVKLCNQIQADCRKQILKGKYKVEGGRKNRFLFQKIEHECWKHMHVNYLLGSNKVTMSSLILVAVSLGKKLLQ